MKSINGAQSYLPSEISVHLASDAEPKHNTVYLVQKKCFHIVQQCTTKAVIVTKEAFYVYKSDCYKRPLLENVGKTLPCHLGANCCQQYAFLHHILSLTISPLRSVLPSENKSGNPQTPSTCCAHGTIPSRIRRSPKAVES